MRDARTGYVFFSVIGAGEASTESGEAAGFGSKADYDGTLDDRAIGAAISDVQAALIARLEERPWRTDVLKGVVSEVIDAIHPGWPMPGQSG